MTHWSTRAIGLATLATLSFASPQGIAQDITYTYDALGRMIEADYDTANKVDQYCYDKLGNRLERIISSSGGTCGSGGGGPSGPQQLTSSGTISVLPPHQPTYGCSSFYYGATYEWCFLQSNTSTIVYTATNGIGTSWDIGYSGRLEVTAAAYGTGQ